MGNIHRNYNKHIGGSGLMVDGTIGAWCATNEPKKKDDTNWIYPGGIDGTKGREASGSAKGSTVFNEFWYRHKDNKYPRNHFRWDKNIKLNGYILQAWLLMCGIHSIIIICHQPPELNIEDNWEDYWGQLHFFSIEYEQAVSPEGAINAHDLTRWLTTEEAINTYNDTKSLEDVLKHLPGYGLTNQDDPHEDSRLKGPSKLGCIELVPIARNLQYSLGLSSRTWKLVDTYRINEGFQKDLAIVDYIYYTSKNFMRNHRYYSLSSKPWGNDYDKAHCQTFANCIWQVLTGSMSNAQGLRS